MDDVIDVAEIAGGLAIAEDVDGLIGADGLDPFRDDADVGAIEVLSWAEDVEVSEGYEVEVKGFMKDVGVGFHHLFGGGVGGEWVA